MDLRRHPGYDMPKTYFDELGDSFPLILDDMFLTVDDCSYVRHSQSYKPVRCGSLHLCETFSILQTCEMWIIAAMESFS
jgi:hypothetical protein